MLVVNGHIYHSIFLLSASLAISNFLTSLATSATSSATLATFPNFPAFAATPTGKRP